MGDTVVEMQSPEIISSESSPSVVESFNKESNSTDEVVAILDFSNQSTALDHADEILTTSPVALVTQEEFVKPKPNINSNISTNNSNTDEGEALTDISADDESPENDTAVVITQLKNNKQRLLLLLLLLVQVLLLLLHHQR
jgi:hypothetical protein